MAERFVKKVGVGEVCKKWVEGKATRACTDGIRAHYVMGAHIHLCESSQVEATRLDDRGAASFTSSMESSLPCRTKPRLERSNGKPFDLNYSAHIHDCWRLDCSQSAVMVCSRRSKQLVESSRTIYVTGDSDHEIVSML
jgi:hypothetical protein